MASSGDPPAAEDGSRRALFRYLTAAESAEYIAIMDLFSATLLTDLSAAELAGQLAERGVEVSRDTAETRCRQLADWGNLVPSIRDARVATVAEYIRSRSRYQVSKLGGRVHRQAVEILHASDGAREVARELLGQIMQSLGRILAMLSGDRAGGGTLDAEALAGEVTTVFSNQRLFTDSVRDFYAYLAGILSRYDLAGAEYAQFKELLLVYIDLITADVSRHAPAVAHQAGLVLAQADRVLHELTTLPGLTSPDGTQVERAQGRTRADWEELAAWYDASRGASGPEQLRAAAGQALGQLITNAKRLLDSSGTGFSRRADFLRLARWFAVADDERAHRLYDAAFGAYPARHLLFGPDEPDPRAGPTTSWWHAEPVPVPVSLRERGDRTMRGRTSRVPDPTADRLRLTAEAAREAEQRKAAAAELALAGALHGATISPAARDLLLDLVGMLLAQQGEQVTDRDAGLRLRAVAGPDTVVSSPDGTTTFVALSLTVCAADAAAENWPEPEWSVAQ
ncbi:MAG TPA: TIGR02677 family protein [Streptosporangiaceae bacterium]